MFRTLAVTLWVLFYLAVSSAVAAPLCQDVYKGKKDGVDLPKDTEVSVYKFFTSNNNNRSLVAVYDLHHGLFKPKQVGKLEINEKLAGDSGSVLLARLQDYSTHMMESSGYISKEVKQRQPELLDSIVNPSQVTFVEMSRPVDKKTVQSQPEKFPQEVKSDRPDEARPDAIHIREAGLWYVSGQYLWPYSREGIARNREDFGDPVDINWKLRGFKEAPKETMHEFDPYRIDFALAPMPWQSSKAVKDSTRLPIRIKDRTIDLDRSRFPLTFELGRVAQSEPGRFRELLRMAAELMAYEVLFTSQSRLSDAYVFVNTMSAARAEAFQKMGFEKLKEACTVPTACILFMRLDKLFEKHVKVTNSYRYARIMGMFPNVDLYDIQNILSRVHTYFRSDLDFIMPTFQLMQRSPVVIHDFSPNYQNMVVRLGMHMGKSYEQAVETYRYLNEWRQDYRTGGRGYEKETPAAEFAQFMEANNFVRITNLNENLTASRDSVELLLMATERFLLSRHQELSQGKDVEAEFQRIDFDYFIHTPSPVVAQNLRRHGYQEGPVMADAKGVPHYGFVIPRQWVKDMINVNPHLLGPLSREGLDQGYWFFRALNAMPMQF